MLIRVRYTYDVVTPESAEDGDYARSGWTDGPRGEWEYDVDDPPEPEDLSFRELVEQIEEYWCLSRHDAGSTTLYQDDAIQDRAYWADGEEKRIAIHYAGADRGRRDETIPRERRYWDRAIRLVLAREEYRHARARARMRA